MIHILDIDAVNECSARHLAVITFALFGQLIEISHGAFIWNNL